MHVFLSVGEPSGDEHAAALMRYFRAREPGVRFSGFGGPEMQSQGLDCLFQLTDLAVMGIDQILPLIQKFRSLVQKAEEFFHRERPDAVVLVDFPGFNWWVARAAKRANVPVYYYCPPQLWAWAPWRIRKARRLIDCVLSVLPFEAEWYESRGVDVEYVGHPFFDEVADPPISPDEVQSLRRDGKIHLGILPGSRKQEVLRNFPVMLNVIEELAGKHPNLRCMVACYKEWHYEKCQELMDNHRTSLPIDLYVDRTSAVIESSDCCLMVSGSVSLELLARKTPAVVMYRGSLMTYILATALLTVEFMSLPNLIAGRELMPEYPVVRSRSRHIRDMTKDLDQLISNPDELNAMKSAITDLADEIVEVGGLARAAEVLHNRLRAAKSSDAQKRAA
ncbi:Lipid-A-disaccharide synthase [Thalassoglobus neptunius]|uniref:Lipid-A-disaccharide synthase n=1 Tax=Thalassoglobus neptunius TaxID=1938619 RepID=A0A5C5WNV9_9PLAN|nr:lipid-A-disaccharide synthase [Thalassoglobus neptunius]TWT52287.1 Lipid-A-disaccharide synthase [Thalassoglobus neptunius]